MENEATSRDLDPLLWEDSLAEHPGHGCVYAINTLARTIRSQLR